MHSVFIFVCYFVVVVSLLCMPSPHVRVRSNTPFQCSVPAPNEYLWLSAWPVWSLAAFKDDAILHTHSPYYFSFGRFFVLYFNSQMRTSKRLCNFVLSSASLSHSLASKNEQTTTSKNSTTEESFAAMSALRSYSYNICCQPQHFILRGGMGDDVRCSRRC